MYEEPTVDAGKTQKAGNRGVGIAMCGKQKGGGVPFAYTCKKYVFLSFSN